MKRLGPLLIAVKSRTRRHRSLGNRPYLLHERVNGRGNLIVPALLNLPLGVPRP